MAVVFVGFALIRLTKCVSGCNSSDKPNPHFWYKFEERTKMGQFVESEIKLNEYWHKIGMKKAKNNGSYGYYHPPGCHPTYVGVDEDEYNRLCEKWDLAVK